MEKLPRTVTIGPKHKIKVVLCSQKILRDLAEVEDVTDLSTFDGLWIPTYGQPVFGTIYIHSKLTQPQRWTTFFHELIHGVNDLHAWVMQGGMV